MLENYNKYKQISPNIQHENGEFYLYDIIITKDLTDEYIDILLQNGMIDIDTKQDLLNNKYKKGDVILNYPNNKLDSTMSSHGVEPEYLEDDSYFCRLATPQEIDNYILQQNIIYEKYATEQNFLSKKLELQKQFDENYTLMTSDDLIIACIVKLNNNKYSINARVVALRKILSDVKSGSEFEFNLEDNSAIIKVSFEPPSKVDDFVKEVTKRLAQYSRNKGKIVGKFNSLINNCKTIEDLENAPRKVWDFDGNNNNWKYDINKNLIILDLTSIELSSINISFYKDGNLIDNQESTQLLLSQLLYNDNV